VTPNPRTRRNLTRAAVRIVQLPHGLDNIEQDCDRPAGLAFENQRASVGPLFAPIKSVRKWFIGFLFLFTAMGQSANPISSAMEAVWSARQEGRFTDAAQHRENARRLLEQMPGDAPEFPAWVKAVADLYSSAGRTADARAVVLRGTELAAASPLNRDM